MSLRQFVTSRVHSIRHALRGWVYVFKTQQNTWVHSMVATIVTLLAFWLKLPARDWAVLVLSVVFVFMAEFINTAIEAVVDLASPQKHPLAKVGKDVGAAAVLIAALAAAVVGLLILGPPLWEKLSSFF